MLPNTPGFWKHQETGDILEVYELEPANGTLCIWGPDVGISYTGQNERQLCWSNDNLQGHIPVHYYIDINYHNCKLGWVLL